MCRNVESLRNNSIILIVFVSLVIIITIIKIYKIMAIIKRGILGGFSKKIGNIVGTSWKGIAVMKSLPLSVANPRTAGQILQRNAFKSASQLASVILVTMIIPLMNRFAIQMSGFNMFMQRNTDNFDVDGISVPATLNFGTGKLGDTPIVSLVAEADIEAFSGTFLNDLDNSFKLTTDKAYLMIYNATQDFVSFSGDTGEARAGGVFSGFTRGENAEGDTYFAYLVFLRADGTVVGNTAYKTGVFTAS